MRAVVVAQTFVTGPNAGCSCCVVWRIVSRYSLGATGVALAGSGSGVVKGRQWCRPGRRAARREADRGCRAEMQRTTGRLRPASSLDGSPCCEHLYLPPATSAVLVPPSRDDLFSLMSGDRRALWQSCARRGAQTSVHGASAVCGRTPKLLRPLLRNAETVYDAREIVVDSAATDDYDALSDEALIAGHASLRFQSGDEAGPSRVDEFTNAWPPAQTRTKPTPQGAT